MWAIVLSLIIIFIIYLVLHYFNIREGIFNWFLRGCFNYFQTYLNPPNQRKENETLHSSDFGTPTNENPSSKSVFNHQDETAESTVLMSQEDSFTTTPRSLDTVFLAVSNQKDDGQKMSAISWSNIYNRNHKVIDRNESRLETIRPDEMKNESISSSDFTYENVVDTSQTNIKSVFTTSIKTQNKMFPFKGIHCKNPEERFKNTRFSKQQDYDRENRKHEFLDTHYKKQAGSWRHRMIAPFTGTSPVLTTVPLPLFVHEQTIALPATIQPIPSNPANNKSSEECCTINTLPPQNLEKGKEDKEQPFKEGNGKKMERDMKSFKAFSKQEDYLKQGNQKENLEGSCSYYQTRSNQRTGEEENQTLPSTDIHTKNIGTCFNTSQTFTTVQDLEKDGTLQSDDILGKNLEVNCNNSLSPAKEKYESEEEQVLPSKTILQTNTKAQEVICGQLISSILGSSSDSPHSTQEDDGTTDEPLPSEDVHNVNDEGHLNETEAVSNQKRDGMKDKNLSSKRPPLRRYFLNYHQKRYFFNSRLVSKQKKINQCGRTFVYKTKVIKQEGEINSKENASKSTVSKEQEKKMCSTEYASEPGDNQKGVGSFLFTLFENQLYTDVTFTSKGNKALLSAHRAVLAAKSEYFKDLLFGDLAKESDGMQMDIEIDTIPFCIFSSIVKWFYTGIIEFPDDHTALEIYKAAKHYKILQLIKECRTYIESMEINEHNVCLTLHMCNTLQVNELKIRCVKYIEKNALSVINSKEFDKSPFNIVREICQLQRLSLKSETDLLHAILRWLKAQPHLKKNAVKDLERALLKCVRFLSFSTKEFSDVISKNPDLFTAKESLNILVYLNNPTPESLEALPKWCNKVKRTLLSSHEKKDPGIRKNLMSEDSELGKIKIKLKSLDVVQDFCELTSCLHMRCVKGTHQITSVKFSFQPVESGGCDVVDLKIIVNVLPNGTRFRKFYSARQTELTFDFTRGVAIREGQVLVMEVTAITGNSCGFFQFDKWCNDPTGNFDCYFISKPTEGRLYFISEVVYEPVAPRLNSTH